MGAGCCGGERTTKEEPKTPEERRSRRESRDNVRLKFETVNSRELVERLGRNSQTVYSPMTPNLNHNCVQDEVGVTVTLAWTAYDRFFADWRKELSTIISLYTREDGEKRELPFLLAPFADSKLQMLAFSRPCPKAKLSHNVPGIRTIDLFAVKPFLAKSKDDAAFFSGLNAVLKYLSHYHHPH